MRKVTDRIRRRLEKGREMTAISIRVPADIIDDLKEIAPSLGYGGYQPLIRAYIGQGLRKDQERIERTQVQALTESLRSQGVADEVISTAIAAAHLEPSRLHVS